MPKYRIEAYLTHKVITVVEAENDDQAEDLAYEEPDDSWKIVSSDLEINDIIEKKE